MLMPISQIRDLVNYCLDECGVSNHTVVIEYSPKLRRTIGKAIHAGPYDIIRLSEKLFERATLAEQEETVIHEAAHVIARKLYGYKVIKEGKEGHGPTWEMIHRKCGMEPNRYHCVSTAGLRSLYDINCICGKVIKVTKTLITRRLNRTGGIGLCPSCRRSVPTPKDYVQPVSYYRGRYQEEF